jgi:hypothetical protein
MKVFAKLLITAIVCCGTHGMVWAHSDASGKPDAPSLITDRPDFTESPQTVPQGMVQVEAGMTFERSSDSRTTTLGETLIRVAAGNKAEVRIGTPSYLRVNDGSGRKSGLDDASLGAKFVLSRRENFPLALIVATTLPTGSRRVAARRFSPEAVLATEVDLSKKTGLAFNVGIARPDDGDGRYNQCFGSVSLGVDVSEKVGAFLEAYAFNRTERGGQSQKFINGGFTYALNPNLRLDARIGQGVGNDTGRSDYFYGFGVSKRY